MIKTFRHSSARDQLSYAALTIVCLCTILPTPSNGQSWQYIAPMHFARQEHSGLALPDGRILIAGGNDGSSALASCEIYSPATNTWVMTGSMHQVRFRFAMALLHDGRVLAGGGLTNLGVGTTDGCELWDPSTGQWQQMTAMPHKRENFPFLVLPDGKVFICGGLDANVGQYISGSEIYDPLGDTYSQRAAMPTAVFGQTVFMDTIHNQILVQGGSYNGLGGTYPPLLQVFDLGANTWALGPNSATSHSDPYALEFPNGTIFTGAGRTGSYSVTDTIEILPPPYSSWLIVGRVTSPRWHGRAVGIDNDSVLIIGGDSHPGGTPNPFDSTNWYLCATQVSRQGPRLNAARTLFVALHSNANPSSPCQTPRQIFAFGGASSSGAVLQTCEALGLGPSNSNIPVLTPKISSILVTKLSECSTGDTSLKLSNSGCDTVTIDSAAIATTPGLTVIGLSPPITIPPNGSITVRVHMQPRGALTDSMNVTVRYHQYGIGDSVKFSLTLKPAQGGSSGPFGGLPKVQVQNFSLIAKCDDQQTSTIFSTGCNPYLISSIVLTGDTANVFNILTTTPDQIKGNSSGSVVVQFSPNGKVGSYSVLVHIHGIVQSADSNVVFDTVIRLQAGSYIPTPALNTPTPALQTVHLTHCQQGDTTLTISNLGCDTAFVDSVMIANTAGITPIGLKTPTIILPHKSLQIRVHLHPNGTATDSLHAVAHYHQYGSTDSVLLSVYLQPGTPGAALTAIKSTVDLGSVSICSHRNGSITYHNSGCDTLRLDSLLGPGAHGFSITNGPTPPLLIPPDSDVTIYITFRPSGGNAKDSVVLYTSHDGTAGRSAVKLTGSSSTTITQLAAFTSNLTMLPVSTCSSFDSSFTVQNPGCDTLFITDETTLLALGLSVDSLTLPFAVPPDSSITIHVHWKPRAAGAVSGSVKLITVSKTGKVKDSVSVGISADGTQGAGLMTVDALQVKMPIIPLCKTTSDSATIHNAGCDTLMIDDATLLGDGDLTLVDPHKGLRIPPGDSATFQVHLNPTSAGGKTGSLTVTWENLHGSLGTHDTVMGFSGSVVSGVKTMAASLNSIDFGTTSLCNERDTSITISNTGCDTIHISAAQLLGAGFTLDPSTPTPIVIKPGEAATVKLNTHIDTTGHPTLFAGSIGFVSDAQNTLPAITMTRKIQYPLHVNLSVRSPDRVKTGGDTVTVGVFTDQRIDTLAIHRITFDLVYREDMLIPVSDTSVNTINETASSIGGKHIEHVTLDGTPVHTTKDSSLATFRYSVALSGNDSTSVTMSNVVMNPDVPSYMPCVASIGGTDSTALRYSFLCGDRMMQEILQGGQVVWDVAGIRPNPLSGSIVIELTHAVAGTESIDIVVRDMLGRQVSRSSEVLSGMGHHLVTLDASRWPSGTLTLELSGNSRIVRRSLVKIAGM